MGTKRLHAAIWLILCSMLCATLIATFTRNEHDPYALLRLASFKCQFIASILLSSCSFSSEPKAGKKD